VRTAATARERRLLWDPLGEHILSPTASIAVEPGAVAGRVDRVVVERTRVRFLGWAADVNAGRPAASVLVFADGRFLRAVVPSAPRGDVARQHDDPGLRRSGFALTLPRREADGIRQLRFFAVAGERASELAYPEGFAWTAAR
jgi:hypothetical protein